MNDKTESSEAASAVYAGGQVVGEFNPFEYGGQAEFAGLDDIGFFFADGNFFCHALGGFRVVGVNIGASAVFIYAEMVA